MRRLKIIPLVLCFSLVCEQAGFAQIAPVQAVPSFHLRYLQYEPDRSGFFLLLDKGREEAAPGAIHTASKDSLRYFLIGLSLPADTFWVNLRPDAPDNIIDAALAWTDIGRVFLEADVQLKKDIAKAASPATVQGAEYWDLLYKKAEELFGQQNITIPTLARPWIVPDEIVMIETGDSAYVCKATLKVMLEQDRIKGDAAFDFKDARMKQLNEYSSQLLRERITPALTREVNTAARYGALRQVYYSLILAQWFKARNRGKGGPLAGRIDSVDLSGLVSTSVYSKDTYFREYQRLFRDGEYSMQKTVQTASGPSIRTYFSGGIRDIAPSISPSVGALPSTDPVTGTRITVIPASTQRLPRSRYTVAVRISASDRDDGFQLVPAANGAALADGGDRLSPLEKKSKEWDNKYVDLRSRLVRADSTKDRLKIMKEIDETAIREIASLNGASGIPVNALMDKRERPWDADLSTREKRDTALREGNDYWYFHGTSLGVLMASALMRGTLGGIKGLAIKRASSEVGVDAEALFFTRKSLYNEEKKGRVVYDEFGYPIEVGGVPDPFAEAFVNAGTFAAITSRPARAVSMYYAFRLEWERRKQAGELTDPSLEFPPVEAFLTRAILRVDRVEGADWGNKGYPEIFSYLPVPLAGVQMMLDNDLPLPDWGLIPTTVLANNDPENLVARYTYKEDMTGKYVSQDPEMRGILNTEEELMQKQINSVAYSIGNRAARAAGWISAEKVFEKIYGRTPATLKMSRNDIDRRYPYSPPDPRAGEFEPETIFDGFKPVKISGKTVNDRGIKKSSSKYLLMLRQGKDGQYYLQSTIRSGEYYQYNNRLQWNVPLGNDEKIALAVFDHFGTEKKVAVMGYRSHLDAASNKMDEEISAFLTSVTAGKTVPGTAQDGGAGKVSGPGGIDLRSLPIVTSAIVGLRAGLDPAAFERAGSFDLSAEWKRIGRMLDAGMVPANERIRECAGRSVFNGTAADVDTAISSLAEMLRLEEQKSLPSDPVVVDALVVLASSRP